MLATEMEVPTALLEQQNPFGKEQLQLTMKMNYVEADKIETMIFNFSYT
jgi:hypothetical protein